MRSRRYPSNDATVVVLLLETPVEAEAHGQQHNREGQTRGDRGALKGHQATVHQQRRRADSLHDPPEDAQKMTPTALGI